MSILESTDAWAAILEPRLEPLRHALERCHGVVEPALVARLRRDYSVDEVAVALQLDAARRRAAVKFSAPQALLCDVEGVAQASGESIAYHKAKRFPSTARIEDLCCGIGGDTRALAAVADQVIAVDRSPARALMTRHNAKVETEVVDVDGRDVTGTFVHIDPSRRHAGARVWRYADCVPAASIIEPILQSAAGAALKLGPGVDWQEIPKAAERECEVIGDRSGLLQTVVWCGELARRPGYRTATQLQPDGSAMSFSALPAERLDVAVEPGRFLLIPAAALERARLVAPRLGDRAVHELAAGLGWLTSDEPIDDPWFERHEIACRMPWRLRRIAQWLAANDGGDVVIRSRGGAVDTDQAQRELRGSGSTRYTVFGVRQGKQLVAYVSLAN